MGSATTAGGTTENIDSESLGASEGVRVFGILEGALDILFNGKKLMVLTYIDWEEDYSERTSN